MYTKEDLLKASPLYNICKKQNQNYFGVLKLEQAKEASVKEKRIVTISDRNVLFFTDDHCFGLGYLPDKFVACTTYFPYKIKNKESFPIELIETLEDYITVFRYDCTFIRRPDKLVEHLNKLSTLIFSIDDLVEYLNKHY